MQHSNIGRGLPYCHFGPYSVERWWYFAIKPGYSLYVRKPFKADAYMIEALSAFPCLGRLFMVIRHSPEART